MIQKIMPSTKTIAKPLSRSSLKKTSFLKDLSTRLYRDASSFKSSHNMIIPGGMTQKEELVYKLTGKFPKSVTDRWHEVHGSDIHNIDSHDQLVSVDVETLANTNYGDGIYSSHATSDATDDDGIISKILDFIF